MKLFVASHGVIKAKSCHDIDRLCVGACRSVVIGFSDCRQRHKPALSNAERKLVNAMMDLVLRPSEKQGLLEICGSRNKCPHILFRQMMQFEDEV